MPTISEIQAESAWLAALQPGDKVIVCVRQHYVRHDSVTTVARVTAKQILVEDAHGRLVRYWKHNGWEVGSSTWHGKLNRLAAWTPEAEAGIALAGLREQVYDACRACRSSATEILTAEQCTTVLQALQTAGLITRVEAAR